MIRENPSLVCGNRETYRDRVTTPSLLLSGLLTGWALIAAIGAQNAFVLRQGIRREHVLPVVAFCVVSDVFLIGGAVLGVGVALEAWPGLVPVARTAGGTFVIGYGLLAGWRAWRGGGRLVPGDGRGPTVGRALLTAAALTWLNPHLYLDILLLGTVANSHGPTDRWWFYGGLAVASLTWFTVVGYLGRPLGRWFTRERAWRALDAGVCVTMVALGSALVLTTH